VGTPLTERKRRSSTTCAEPEEGGEEEYSRWEIFSSSVQREIFYSLPDMAGCAVRCIEMSESFVYACILGGIHKRGEGP
jgi:hypothetical protein